MIRLFISFIFFFGVVDAKEDDIGKKIDTTSSKLNSYSQDYKTVSQKMEENAAAIIKQKAEIDQQQESLKQIKLELDAKEGDYKDNKSQLDELKSYNGKLKSDQDGIEQELVFVIAQSVSLSLILEEEYAVDAESLIEFEVLQKMLKTSKDRASHLNQNYFANAKEIEVLKEHTSTLQLAIASIDSKRKQALAAHEANKKSLEKLQLAEESYKKELKELLGKQDELKNTLEKLNIIKLDAIKEAQKKEDLKVAFDNKRIELNKDTAAVKKVGNSYQEPTTAKYTGEKTIAPLDAYTITKKYGAYTDPIYGLKIFNESISLKAKEEDAKVKTVFNGKIIYADKTAVLNNIVIVEHDDGLHTIYANLSQIAPNIEKGQKVKKGFTIGRVSGELVFEVTQKSFHIDPAVLFQ
ncbi:MAG: peptidoglycan DD-metalloendopeptidase family protein [Campylobacterales bacterium]|nr:peptidoglycan DD-metalloendopeptidase family protein [Campylobacterales bacterium]